MLSNVAAGTTDHIDALFRAQNQEGLIQSVINMSGTEVMMVRKEAMWTVCNIITTSTKKYHFNALIRMSAIDKICKMLRYNEDVRLLLSVLNALEVILVKNEENGTIYDRIVDECGGVELLEMLQEHKSLDVYNCAISLLERFFGGEEVFMNDHENENVLPLQNDTTFEFSVPKQLFPDHCSITQTVNNYDSGTKTTVHYQPYNHSNNELRPLVHNFGSPNALNVVDMSLTNE